MAVGASLVRKICTLGVVMLALPGMDGRIANLNNRLLEAHNLEREAMGVPALRWDPALARSAKDWAQYLAETGKFEHSPNAPGLPRQGENIWGGTRGVYAPEDMVDLWIQEKSHFVMGVFPNNSRTGRVQDVSHYTQLIWRDTTEVGCGISEGAVEEIVVCRYRGPGNVIGNRPL